MRYFFSQRIPDFNRVLIVESGSRELLDNLLPGLNELYGDTMTVDLLTCYAGHPVGFLPEKGKLYRVTDYPDSESRARLFRELRKNDYQIVGIICSGEPIMTKWKWMTAWKINAKLFVLNENVDYLWADYSNWRIIAEFFAFRTGLTGTGAVMTPVRVLLFPFTFLYLLLFAAWVNMRRKKVTL